MDVNTKVWCDLCGEAFPHNPLECAERLKTRAETAEERLAEVVKRHNELFDQWEATEKRCCSLRKQGIGYFQQNKQLEQQLVEAQLTIAGLSGEMDGMREVVIGLRKRIARLEEASHD